METSADKLLAPGDSVGDPEKHKPGHGVCLRNNKLVATIAGLLVQEQPKKLGGKATLRVSTLRHFEQAPALPEIGSVITGKVTSVNPRAAHLEILVVDGKPLKELFKGTIRQQDVRRTETDKVEIYRCFCPNDIVRAEVISLGDRHSYFLSTAKNELGVIYAKSKAGVAMIPHSWQEMECPATKAKEFRKVAKQ